MISCLAPITLYKRDGQPPTTVRPFGPAPSFPVRCGKCVLCIKAKAADWAGRVIADGKVRPAWFVTLTFSDEFLPAPGRFTRAELIGFLKRLRQRVKRHGGPPFQALFHPELSPRLHRAHWHGGLFGFDPWDAVAAGRGQFRSEVIESAWGCGMTRIAPMIPERAHYLAGHQLDKVANSIVPLGFNLPKPVIGRGIGRKFVDKYGEQLVATDFLMATPGRVMRPPRFFDKLTKRRFPEAYARNLERRMEHAQRPVTECDAGHPDRVAARAEVLLSEIQSKRRGGD